MVDVSIITPVFNAEKYLSKCIESVLGQIVSNWELLLIDDGSTDNSLAICNRFSSVDTRIKVFTQTNQGPSCARNLGISQASGKWICFLDADDWIDSDFLLKFESKHNDNDLIFQGFKLVYESGQTEVKMIPLKSIDVPKDQLILELLKFNMFGWTCIKQYRKSIIDKYNIRFDSKYKFREDFLFTMEYCIKCGNVSFVEAAGYNYLQLTNSLAHRVPSVEMFYSMTLKLLEISHPLFYFNELGCYLKQIYLQDIHNSIKDSYKCKEQNIARSVQRNMILTFMKYKNIYSQVNILYSHNPFINLVISFSWKIQSFCLLNFVFKTIFR